MLIQGILVIGSLSGEMFFGIGTKHILPIYTVLWIATCLEVLKSEKKNNE